MRSYFKNFEAEEAKYDNRIKELFNELETACDELEALQNERTAILRDVMGNEDVTAINGRIEALEAKIAQLKERTVYAEEYKLQQLAQLLDDVEDKRQRAVMKKENEYENAIQELNRKKIEFLNSAVRIGELAREINKVNDKANECRRTAGVDPLRHWPFENRMTLNASPALNGFDDASWKTLAVPEWLVGTALRDGILPTWSKELMVDE